MSRQAENIILHISDSHGGTVEDINEWHRQRGWRNPVTGKSIGYNGVIYNGYLDVPGKIYSPQYDGLFFEGRGIDLNSVITPDERGAHALGYNYNSLGICCIAKGKPSEKQLETFKFFCQFFLRINPRIKILGHNDVNATHCPGMDVKKWAVENIPGYNN